MNPALKILMNLAKVHAMISRRFDRLNVQGIGLNDLKVSITPIKANLTMFHLRLLTMIAEIRDSLLFL